MTQVSNVPMKNTLLLLVGILILVLGGGGIVYYFHSKSSGTVPLPHPSFPTSESTGSVGGGSTSFIGIQGEDGSTIQAKDFLIDPTTKEDPVNKGYFYLGSQSEDAPYMILYIKDTQFFTIELLKEPLGENRRAAETYLEKLLGLSNDSMCALAYMVSTPSSISQTYAGTSLGFSFCPNAVRLP